MTVRTQLDRGLAAADEDRRHALAVVDGQLASGSTRPELDVAARAVELDDDLAGVVEDRDGLWPDPDAVGAGVVSNDHRTGVVGAADQNLEVLPLRMMVVSPSSSDCTRTRPVSWSAIVPPTPTMPTLVTSR